MTDLDAIRARLDAAAATPSTPSRDEQLLREDGWEHLAPLFANAPTDIAALLAEVDRLHSWDGLMELLDEHWPADIFPTLPDDDSRDPGPRIVSLLRWVDRLREALVEIRGLSQAEEWASGPIARKALDGDAS